MAISEEPELLTVRSALDPLVWVDRGYPIRGYVTEIGEHGHTYRQAWPSLRAAEAAMELLERIECGDLNDQVKP